MSGNTNFPTALDDDTSLINVTDTVTAIAAAHHNNLKEAIKAVEAKIGIRGSLASTSLDYRIGHPTDSHSHNGASGQGQKFNPSAIPIPPNGIPSGQSLYEHLTNAAIHGGGPDATLGNRTIISMDFQGSIPSSGNFIAPLIIGRTYILESISAALRRGPSGATLALTPKFGPTAVFVASALFRPIFAPGATTYRSNQVPNYVTYPSGAVITVDSDAVGSNEPGSDLTITFVFRN